MPNDLSLRIQAIQRKINVTHSGEYDANTINKLVSIMQITSNLGNFQAQKEAIQRKLGFTGNQVDGIFGVSTTTRLERFVKGLLPDIPNGASMIVSKKGIDQIIKYEVSSEAAYTSKYQNPIWPQGQSGVTIGIGYDLGYETPQVIATDWGGVLPATDIAKLKAVAGKQGVVARDALQNNVGDIQSVAVPFVAARTVFYQASLPNYARLTKSIYPGVSALPPDAQAAILSLIYNRGAGLEGDRRTEMRNMVALINNGNLAGIAAEFRSMKRLWTNPSNIGVAQRREKEAIAIENATFFFNDNDIVIV